MATNVYDTIVYDVAHGDVSVSHG
ncbi:unnamed protein product, partial [Rotaria sp. Silwood1]